MSTSLSHARSLAFPEVIGREAMIGKTLADKSASSPSRDTKPGGLVARDPVMLDLVRRAKQVAPANASVLIFGETGTGKEVIAHYIHENSRRADGPFVAVNCAAIPEQLLESELFGHERGAFSGALGQRIGKLESANHGTILLDEISEMDKRLQAKLLRAVQEREVDRVGGRSPVSVDVRIIATTNKDLSVEVSKQNFREDLFFRLNVISLHIPSLRERPDDIAPLAEFFIERYRSNSGPRRLSDSALKVLLAHDWPGNVRELENAVHRAMVLTNDAVITDAALEIRPNRSGSVQPDLRPDTALKDFKGRRLMQVERDVIIETLKATNGNRTKAAAILGLSIRALRNKLNLYTADGAQLPHKAITRVQ